MKKILLIDDDSEFLLSNKAVIESRGYQVITANDAVSGMRLAKDEYPHLVILDVMMQTDTEGFEVSRKLRDIPELKRLPVILLTGIRAVMGIHHRIMPDETWLPVRSVLDKPVAPELLLAEIERLLN
ncbi:MAG: response regulator [Kiritimatiellae bacterium]|nr:response regulator [Kiritimatiellia bacterium]